VAADPGTACACGCGVPARPAHAIAAALAVDDLDRALDLGLLEAAACTACSPACTALLERARAGRLAAFAARDRHRAREARLQRGAAERAERRAARTPAPDGRPALPPAAADALARALAKARHPGRKPGR